MDGYLGQTSDPLAPVSRLPIPTELARAPKHMVKKLQDCINNETKVCESS